MQQARDQAGDILHLIDLDGIFVLTSTVPIVPELANEIERMRREAGLSTEELLASLREQREQVHLEHYGDAQTVHAGSAGPTDR